VICQENNIYSKTYVALKEIVKALLCIDDLFHQKDAYYNYNGKKWPTKNDTGKIKFASHDNKNIDEH
jgi:hypothetical protein